MNTGRKTPFRRPITHQLKLSKHLIVSSHFSLSLMNFDFHLCLSICCCRKHLTEDQGKKVDGWVEKQDYNALHMGALQKHMSRRICGAFKPGPLPHHSLSSIFHQTFDDHNYFQPENNSICTLSPYPTQHLDLYNCITQRSVFLQKHFRVSPLKEHLVATQFL